MLRIFPIHEVHCNIFLSVVEKGALFTWSECDESLGAACIRAGYRLHEGKTL
jgi:hypothetical protein